MADSAPLMLPPHQPGSRPRLSALEALAWSTFGQSKWPISAMQQAAGRLRGVLSS